MSQCASRLLVDGVTNIEELVRVMPYAAIRKMVEQEPAAERAG
jgi:hypothetical protein